MSPQSNQIKFASGIGWVLQSLTFRPAHQVAEMRFTKADGRLLQLTLRRACAESLIEALQGFDFFEILVRENLTPYAEFNRFLCRFYRDDDQFDTVIDEFEIEDTEPEPGAAPNGGPAASVDNPRAAPGPPSVS